MCVCVWGGGGGGGGCREFIEKLIYKNKTCEFVNLNVLERQKPSK